MARSNQTVVMGIAGLAVVGVALYAAIHLQAQAPQATIGGYQAPVDVDTTALPGPTQPIFYRHDIHAGQYGMDCRYCHYAAEVSPSPGLPSLDTCMGCHILVGAGNPEVEKVKQAYFNNEPVEWVEIHNIPSYVRFPHMRHVAAEVTCQECHGPVEEMPQVYQFASLKMGWCLSCHQEREVTTDCTACHY